MNTLGYFPAAQQSRGSLPNPPCRCRHRFFTLSERDRFSNGASALPEMSSTWPLT
jgi:hypothetical protein